MQLLDAVVFEKEELSNNQKSSPNHNLLHRINMCSMSSNPQPHLVLLGTRTTAETTNYHAVSVNCNCCKAAAAILQPKLESVARPAPDTGSHRQALVSNQRTKHCCNSFHGNDKGRSADFCRHTLATTRDLDIVLSLASYVATPEASRTGTSTSMNHQLSKQEKVTKCFKFGSLIHRVCKRN